MKKAPSIRKFLTLLLLFTLAAPASARLLESNSELVVQAQDAPAAPVEVQPEEKPEKTEPKKTKPVVAQTKEGKTALIIVVCAVIGLFILIFIKSSKLG